MAAKSADYRKLTRSRDNRMIAGVCGGIGEYSNIDPTVIRALFIIGTIMSGGMGVFAYLALAIVMPEEA